MRTMTGWEMHEPDLLDEEYLGPPPRFLVEDRSTHRTIADVIEDEEAGSSPFDRLKSLLGFGTS